MTRFRLLMGCLMVGSAGLLATANAGAQITKVGDGYLFRVKYVKGKTTHYQMTTKTTLPAGAAGPASNKPMTMNMALPLTMTVVSVAGNKATIKADVGTMTMNGKPFAANGQAMPKQASTQMTVDDRGQIVGQIQGGGAGMGMENLSGTLPEKPLKVGQSFTASKTMTQMGQSIQMKTTSTFLGIKNVGGKQVAEMALKVAGSGTVTLTGTGTGYYNLADGSLNTVTMTNNMTMSIPGQAQKMNMKVNTETKSVAK